MEIFILSWFRVDEFYWEMIVVFAIFILGEDGWKPDIFFKGSKKIAFSSMHHV